MKKCGLGREPGSEETLEYVESETRYFGGIGERALASTVNTSFLHG